ncbi:MAG TPA: hypothetical protein EYH45_03115 [Candidatus Caldiarchaeum subterraneum]|uniref:Uncharacterized protein n=1 Tax=Caldiarchaeum subterraneum TaxID=311458 RepID=A0A833E9T4_CALS0|nr:hypothetical protein [Candidatus Caldarchaeum subterraneum]
MQHTHRLRQFIILLFFLSTLISSAYSLILTVTDVAAAAAGEDVVNKPADVKVSFLSPASNPLTVDKVKLSFLNWQATSGSFRVRVEVIHSGGTSVGEETVTAGASSATITLNPPLPSVRRINRVEVYMVRI